MLYDIPIEPLEERYSTQWAHWFHGAFGTRCMMPWHRVLGKAVPEKIKDGAFLDVVQTNIYKASQLQRLCEMAAAGDLGEGDILFFHDLWFPGLEMLAYIRDGLGMKFKIYGCLHAGVYDPNDFLAKKGMRPWALPLETCWMHIVDGIFVATDFHKKLILHAHPEAANKVHVTGFPIYPIAVTQPVKELNLVVFPHRLNDEKRPDLFGELKEMLGPAWNCVRTKDVCKTKTEYFDLLARASVAVSFAEQETWGIAMQEAMFQGCVPVVPNRLSYVEMYSRSLRFDTMDEAAQLVRDYEKNKFAAQLACERAMKSGAQAVERIMCKMGVWNDNDSNLPA